MPKAIDTEKLNDPSLQVMDIGNPPTKSIAHQEFPKMVYLHPKDKTKQHLTKIVHHAEEQEHAEAAGYKTKPHLPVEKAVDLSEEFEAEKADEDPLESMTKPQLIAEAKVRGVEVDPTANKAAILAAMKSASEE